MGTLKINDVKSGKVKIEKYIKKNNVNIKLK